MNKNTEDIFIKACKNNNIKRVKLILNKYKHNLNYLLSDTQFILKILHVNNASVLKYLIDKQKVYNYNINICYDQILYYVCIIGNTEALKYLLNYYETINYEIDIWNGDNNLFRLACCYPYIDIIKYLIEYSEKKNNRFDMQYFDTYINVTYGKNRSNMLKYVKYLIKHNYKLKTSCIHPYIELFVYKRNIKHAYGIKYNFIHNNEPRHIFRYNTVDCLSANYSFYIRF